MDQNGQRPAVLETNIFLNALMAVGPPHVTEAVEPCELTVGHILHEADEPFSEVYFPSAGMVSLVVPLKDNKVIEVAIVGREGVVGLPAVLDGRQNHLRALVQIPGHGHRLGVGEFQEAVEADAGLMRMVHRYMLAKLQYIAQSVACNRLHNVEQRLCRWLLACHDRVVAGEFPLTQMFLSQMLAVQRPTVSEAAARLQYKGLITYKRGVITILDRQGLERAACECYGVISREYDRLMGDGASSAR